MQLAARADACGTSRARRVACGVLLPSNGKPSGLLVSARWRAKLSQLPEQNSSVPLQRLVPKRRRRASRAATRALLELPRAAS